MNIHQWRMKWGVPQQALDELAALSVVEGDGALSEGGVQSLVRLEGSRRGIYLWRNNVGAGKVVLEDGGASRFIRWGLANDSAQLNDAVKSADLIGIRRIHITPDMVGSTVGQFVSREIKKGDWKYSGTLRECAQLQWASLINGAGGDAKIVSGPGSFN